MKTSKFNIVIIAVLTIFVKSNLYAQFDRYSDEYHEGNIELIDGSFSEGKIKTHLLQKARLKFISKERIDEVEKYKLAEVKRFRIDSADFIILRDVVLIDSYAREGTNKFCIGEIIYDSVDIQILKVYYGFYNPTSMVSGNVVNLVLVDNNNQSITIPSIERIRKNKFEKIKVKLIDYLKPTRLECLIQDIQLMQREDDLISIFLEFAGCLK